MKKLFNVAMMVFAIITLVACGQENPPKEPSEGPAFTIKYKQNGNMVDVTAGTTIQVAGINETTGSIDLDGILVNNTERVLNIEVDVTRESTGYEDQLCVGVCVPGNGEKTQTFSFKNLSDNETEMFAHLIPSETKKYTIEYFFHEQGESDGIKFTVIYNNEK